MTPQRPAPLEAVLLDLDGTLIDSLDLLKTVYRDFVSDHGGSPSNAEFDTLNGPPLAIVVAALRTHHGLSDPVETLLADYSARIEAHYTAVPPRPGARDFLHGCAERGIVTALVSSAQAGLIDAWLTASGLGDLFGVRVAGDHVAAGKPSPAPYRHALQELDVAAEDAVAIEDSPAGLASARAAGLACLHFGTPECPDFVHARSLLLEESGWLR